MHLMLWGAALKISELLTYPHLLNANMRTSAGCSASSTGQIFYSDHRRRTDACDCPSHREDVTAMSRLSSASAFQSYFGMQFLCSQQQQPEQQKKGEAMWSGCLFPTSLFFIIVSTAKFDIIIAQSFSVMLTFLSSMVVLNGARSSAKLSVQLSNKSLPFSVSVLMARSMLCSVWH